MGGIYLGIFTATEAAGIGAFGAFIIVVLKGNLSLISFKETLIETVKITSMLFFTFWSYSFF